MSERKKIGIIETNPTFVKTLHTLLEIELGELDLVHCDLTQEAKIYAHELEEVQACIVSLNAHLFTPELDMINSLVNPLKERGVPIIEYALTDYDAERSTERDSIVLLGDGNELINKIRDLLEPVQG